VTGTTSYLVDCSSYQGVPAWAKTAAVCVGGAEKVTEGTTYTNPDWGKSKAGLKQVAAHGFVPLAYLFMDPAGTGAAQAQYFSSEAGDLTGFGIVIDFERSAGGSPTLGQAQQCAAELRKLYPHHPIGGYAPHWYTGGENLSFCDWLWASEYVNGSGDPAMLYAQVPAAWWAPYGGKSPLMLQFTSSASVAGISGPVDCSAFHGPAAQLAAVVLPPKAVPVKPPVVTPTKEAAVADPGVLVQLSHGDLPVNVPVADALPGADFRIVVTGDTGSVVTATAWFTDGSGAQALSFPLNNGRASSVVFRRAWSGVSTVKLQRSDTKATLAASAFIRF
jgi:GH25 family lysozyme M1 (1,4-beta-N-acetylmuramidase)